MLDIHDPRTSWRIEINGLESVPIPSFPGSAIKNGESLTRREYVSARAEPGNRNITVLLVLSSARLVSDHK